MSLKSWIDGHPIPTAIGIAVSSVTAGVGVSEYFHDRSVERLEQENSIMTGQLKARLAGIERRVGGGEQTFFDISRLVIPSAGVSSLGTEFSNIADGAVFVDVPADGNWGYSVVSEADLVKMVLPNAPDGIIPNISMLSEKNVHLWRASGSYEVPTSMGPNMVFFPYVMVQAVDNDKWAGALTEIAKASDLSELEDTLAKIQSNDSAATSRGEGSVRRSAEIEQRLSSLFRGNLALVFLSGTLQSNLGLTQVIPEANLDITSIEKRGNVLYAQSRLKIGGGEKQQGKAIIVATEMFVVTMPTRTILVRSVVPSRDGRSDAFQWVTRFLAGLRVPLDRG